jgi:IS30 family transposase
METGGDMTRSRGWRRRLTPAERERVWREWRAGSALEVISAGLAMSSTGVRNEIRTHGGIAPAPARRRPQALTVAERECLARWRVGAPDGVKVREAARRLGRAPSTVSREIQRNGERTATTRHYDAATADARAWRRARRPKPCVLATRPALRVVVAQKLAADWSPAQIAAWLRMTYPDEPAMQLSAETMYRSLYVQTRGVLKQELTAHLRRGHSLRRSRGRTATARTGAIVDGVSIARRPPEIAARAVPGHWEGDLLAGGQHSQIATLVERASRFVVLVRVPSKESPRVVDALIDAVHRLPAGLMRSLTWDRGSELAQHQRFTIATESQVFFCDPRSPWQRGTNENTNGLLRQYFPKGMDLSDVTQAQLDAVALKLNTRPRQTLGWATPATALSRLMRGVALTG